MRRRAVPDGLIYLVLVTGLLITAHLLRRRDDAPPAPPAPPGAAGLPVDPALRLSPAAETPIRTGRAQYATTATAVGPSGTWLAPRSMLAGCARPVLLANDRLGLAATMWPTPDPRLVLLKVRGDLQGLGRTPAPPRSGDRGFIAGYVRGSPAEIAVRYLGQDPSRLRGPQSLQVWAETGRTLGVGGALTGLGGAPVLTPSGAVAGLVVKVSLRRGKIYAAPAQGLGAVLPTAGAPGEPVTLDNYGRAADALRRDLRVARVLCLKS